MRLPDWSIKDWLNAAAAVAMIAASGVLIWLGVRSAGLGQNDATAWPPVPVDFVAFRGDAELKVVVFSDYYCPACRAFAANVVPEIVRAYVDTGRVSLGYVPFPITRSDGRSIAAVTFSECARRQGVFWEAHEFLFGATLDEDFDAAATPTWRPPGGDGSAFSECLRSGGVADGILAYTAKAREAGIRMTPTTVIGELRSDGSLEPRSVLPGVRTVSELKAVLDRILG